LLWFGWWFPVDAQPFSIEVTWTGVGPLTRYNEGGVNRYHTDMRDEMWVGRATVTRRDATAVAVIGGGPGLDFQGRTSLADLYSSKGTGVTTRR